MKFKGKLNLGEVSAPGENVVLKDIQLEYECEYSIGEAKGTLEIIRQLPDLGVEIAEKMRAAFKKFEEQDKVEKRDPKFEVKSIKTEQVRSIKEDVLDEGIKVS